MSDTECNAFECYQHYESIIKEIIENKTDFAFVCEKVKELRDSYMPFVVQDKLGLTMLLTTAAPLAIFAIMADSKLRPLFSQYDCCGVELRKMTRAEALTQFSSFRLVADLDPNELDAEIADSFRDSDIDDDLADFAESYLDPCSVLDSKGFDEFFAPPYSCDIDELIERVDSTYLHVSEADVAGGSRKWQQLEDPSTKVLLLKASSYYDGLVVSGKDEYGRDITIDFDDVATTAIVVYGLKAKCEDGVTLYYVVMPD